VRRLLRRLDYWLHRERHDAELREEMAAHRAMLGRPAFGNETLAREDARAVWVWRWADEAWQDVRYTARSMRRQPGFSAAAIAILGLGMGATICVFGLLDALTLRSLPVDRADRLVYFSKPAFSYPIFTEVRARMPVFEGMFGWNIDRAYVHWSGLAGEPAPADVLEATGEFFTTLHVTAAIGRTFGPGDAAVAVISHGAWQRHFGGTPDTIGRSIHVGGTPFTIVGVTPRGFSGVAPGLAPEVMIPVAGRYAEGSSVFTTPTSSWLHLMSRLRDGVTDAQAQAALRTVWPAVLEATTNPGAPPDRRARYLGRQTSLESARTGFSPVRDQFADPLRLLMALVGLLLAVACASVANLLLARGVARRKELSVRLAIGAGRARVFRQLVTEALVLTLTGGTIALLLSSWGASLLVAFLTTSGDSLALDTAPGPRTLVFSAALAVVVSLVSALFPAMRASRDNVIAGLKETEPAAAGALRRWSAGKALVALQVALALVLVAGAAVFGRSLARILAQDIGLDAANVLIVAPNTAAAGYNETAQRAFAIQLLDRLRQLPGVESAALSWMPPISTTMGNWTQSIGVDGGPLQRDAPFVYFNGVSPRYFETVGMRLRRGRDFADGDTAATPRVAIVNEALARRFFPGQDPIGRRITIGRTASRKDLEIIGLVQDAKYRTMQEPQRNIAYLSIAQVEDVTSGRDLFAEVRTANLAATAAQARQMVRALDARVPVRAETVADRIRESTLTERVMAILAAALGATALVLACASLYGLLAYGVSRRRGEIGVRIALGAPPASVVWMVQRESIALALAGVVAGLAAAVALARYVATSLLFQISPADPIALGSAGATMLAVAALAAYLPARRAAAVDPVVALKTEA
jgi:putative ABC transport system permease protein